MRPILASRTLDIPSDVTVTVQARKIVVKGPRGELKKDLSHICADMYIDDSGEDGAPRLHVDCHFRSRKELSSLRTVISHVNNMIIGVTKGYRCGTPRARFAVVCRRRSGARAASVARDGEPSAQRVCRPLLHPVLVAS